MDILSSLFGPHARNLERAMDRTTQRFGLLSDNLGNANVSGYKRKDVDFGVELENAERGLNRFSDPVQSGAGSIRVDGNSVDMEKEVVALAETEMRFQLLTEMTSRYFSGLKNVIKEGR